ncbi:MAG: bacillithiol biosynthesis deacetylase BshB1 [Sphingobacteriales bacterium]|nr:MAG: bacillithiol biosynthesis deacetylase BshB1 [Sphingobacteriales bacterium]TAF82537.1 MAG: bacillithiol biosynthesis deacetylase BshB1 [Sphingobacteriales bacterium]
MKLDLLFIAAHPDDVELCSGGTILKHIQLGKKVGILDLTRGELGTRGTAQTRDAEAKNAAQILGIHWRENLGFRDGFFVNDEYHRIKIIEKIREFTPEIIITNAYHDRHPDHGRASELVYDACFLAGLPKIKTNTKTGIQQSFRPSLLLHFIQDNYIKPDFLIDITPYHETKMAAIRAYTTQFFSAVANTTEPETYISNPVFLDTIIARSREFGKAINATYAEGFLSKKLLGVDSFFDLR